MGRIVARAKARALSMPGSPAAKQAASLAALKASPQGKAMAGKVTLVQGLKKSFVDTSKQWIAAAPKVVAAGTALGVGGAILTAATAGGRVAGMPGVASAARRLVRGVLSPEGAFMPVRRRSRGISGSELRGFRKVATLLKRYAGTVRRMPIRTRR